MPLPEKTEEQTAVTNDMTATVAIPPVAPDRASIINAALSNWNNSAYQGQYAAYITTNTPISPDGITPMFDLGKFTTDNGYITNDGQPNLSGLVLINMRNVYLNNAYVANTVIISDLTNTYITYCNVGASDGVSIPSLRIQAQGASNNGFRIDNITGGAVAITGTLMNATIADIKFDPVSGSTLLTLNGTVLVGNSTINNVDIAEMSGCIVATGTSTTNVTVFPNAITSSALSGNNNTEDRPLTLNGGDFTFNNSNQNVLISYPGLDFTGNKGVEPLYAVYLIRGDLKNVDLTNAIITNDVSINGVTGISNIHQLFVNLGYDFAKYPIPSLGLPPQNTLTDKGQALYSKKPDDNGSDENARPNVDSNKNAKSNDRPNP